MKKVIDWSFKKHVFLSAGITLAVALVQILFINENSFILRKLLGIMKLSNIFSAKEAASIGIIGGSDGPTTIFLVGNPISTFLIPILVLFAILLVFYKPIKKLIHRSMSDD